MGYKCSMPDSGSKLGRPVRVNRLAAAKRNGRRAGRTSTPPIRALLLWLGNLLGESDEMALGILHGELTHAIKCRAFGHHFLDVVQGLQDIVETVDLDVEIRRALARLGVHAGGRVFFHA